MAPAHRIHQIFAPGEFTATTTVVHGAPVSTTPTTSVTLPVTPPKPLSDFERKLAAGAYGRSKKITKLNPVAVAFEPKTVVDGNGNENGEVVPDEEEINHHAVCDVLDLLIARCAGKGMKASRWAN